MIEAGDAGEAGPARGRGRTRGRSRNAGKPASRGLVRLLSSRVATSGEVPERPIGPVSKHKKPHKTPRRARCPASILLSLAAVTAMQVGARSERDGRT